MSKSKSKSKSKKRNCPDCEATLTITRENCRYNECGLPNVTLIDVEVRRCSACGWTATVIPNVDGLHRTLALLLIHQESQLRGAEFRYLRKYLGYSGVDFACLLGVTPETISRWENDREGAVQPLADRLMRVLVATREPLSSYPIDELKKISRDNVAPVVLGLRTKDSHWEQTELVA